jgi:hypothetical protein
MDKYEELFIVLADELADSINEFLEDRCETPIPSKHIPHLLATLLSPAIGIAKNIIEDNPDFEFRAELANVEVTLKATEDKEEEVPTLH